MKSKLICAALIVFAAININAQQPSEERVPLSEKADALDSNGNAALSAMLRTTDLKGAIDSPVTNVRLVVENSSTSFYTYVSGLITFYDSGGVRCGEGQFKLDALDVGESAETDTPGLRLRCTPVAWRIVANNLLPRSGDNASNLSSAQQDADNIASVPAIPQLEITINGETFPLQLGNPININTRRKRKVHIVVNAVP